MGSTKKVQGTLSSFFKPKPAATSGDKARAPVVAASSALSTPVAESPKPTARRKSQAAEGARKRRRVVDTGDSDDDAHTSDMSPAGSDEDEYKDDIAPQARPKLSKRSISGFLHSGTGNAGHSAGRTLVRAVSDPADMVERLRMRIKESDTLGTSEETGPDEPMAAATFGSLDGTSIQLVQRRRGVKYTPLEIQVLEAKERHPDILLAVEVGYKYRFFGEDARIASRVLGIMCTCANNFYNASIPTPRLMVHVRRLVHAGYKVGVVRQQETAALKAVSDNKNAPFTRQLAEVYTTGTLVEEVAEHAIDSSDQYLMCVVESPSTSKDKCANLGIMAVQITTGNVVYDNFEDSFLRSALETRLTHLQPGELLVPPHLSSETLKTLSSFAGHTINYDEAREPLLEHASRSGVRVAYASGDLADPSAARRFAADFYTSHGANSQLPQVLDLPDPVVAALAMLVKYLEPFNLTRAMLTGGIGGSRKLLFAQFHTHSHMLLSATALQTLSVFAVTSSVMGSSTAESAVALKDLLKPGARLGGCHSKYVRGGDGSLFSVMDHTRSQFGRRMLRRWVAHPLVSRDRLEERMDAVEYLKVVMEDSDSGDLTRERQVVASIHAKIGQLVDVERGLCRIQYRQASPQELLRILRSFECAMSLLPDDIEVTEPRLIAQLLSRDTWTLDLRRSIAEWKVQIDYKSAKSGHKETLFTRGSLHDKIQQHHDQIAAIESELESSATTIAGQLGLSSLEFKTISGIDYLIDVKNALAKQAPANWVKISGTKTNVRFHTPFIVEKLAERERCREALRQAARDAYNEFLGGIAEKYSELRELISSLATLDALFSLAQLARTEGYCRPEFATNTDNASVDLVDAVNPVLSQGLPTYVPNSVSLGSGASSPRAMILTGPNAGGKSSLIRTVALTSVMAQCGSYVPARQARLSIIDAIYTRIGASDNLMAGESTFMVEMRETAELMRQITPRSLVIIDELGRGTSTHDGAAIAYAVLDHLVSAQPLTFFVTHYAHLVDAFAANTLVRSCHMSYLEHQPKSADNIGKVPITNITFLYKLADGASADSFGLNVARMAGLPASLLLRARDRSLWMRTEMESRWAAKCARDLRRAISLAVSDSS
ncbi:Mismatch repair protein msh3 [Coemansia aciculifera]|nr:Mismatch repair protein msh3 [Coemansia aciculifera]